MGRAACEKTIGRCRRAWIKLLRRTGHLSAAGPCSSSRKKRSVTLASDVAETTALAASSTSRAALASSPSAARSAQRVASTPNAASARSGFGWAEIFVALDGVELPARPDFYDIPRPENRIPGPPRLDDGESDDDDDDAAPPSPTVRRQFCVIS